MGDASVYQFLGRYFLDYVDVETFKQRVKEELNYNAEPFQIESAYEHITDSDIANKGILDEILFENILYGSLRNVFIETLDFNPNIDVSTFRKRMEGFIQRTNYGKLDRGLEKFMSPDGFLLMESISTSKIGTFFLAGFDYKKNSDDKVSSVRMLFSNVVPLTRSPNLGYFLAGVDIDLEGQTCLIMFKNITNEIDNEYEEDEIDWENSIIKYFNKIKRLVFPLLGLKTTINFKIDRKAMFKMCKDLDSQLLEEFRDEMSRKLPVDDIKISVDTLLGNLLPTNVVPNPVIKEKLIKRFQSLLLSTFINTVSSDEDLIDIAKERGLYGFPTNISFKSGKSSKGATGTSVKDIPISGEVMFHSLYTDFDESLELPQWSISWFRDYTNAVSTDTEVVQTTIKSTKNYIMLIFKNRKHLNEELIKHVVGQINRYRMREIQGN